MWKKTQAVGEMKCYKIEMIKMGKTWRKLQEMVTDNKASCELVEGQCCIGE